jgi:CRISPR type IV-associated DEAD/DEAH-box helicase Csf4
MPSVPIPASLCRLLHPDFDGEHSSPEAVRFIRLAAKSMIEAAIRDELQPATLPPVVEPGITQNLSFAARDDRVLRSTAKVLEVTESEAARRYLFAAIARGDAISHRVPAGGGKLQRYLQAVGKVERHAQNVFYLAVLESIRSGGIGLVEGATGLGKTLALIAAASEVLAGQQFGRVAIATPSIQLMRQFVTQHRSLDVGMDDLPSFRVVLGQQEFVSRSELAGVLRDGELLVDPDPILGWIEQGGPACGDAVVMGHNWLCQSLLAVSPDFPVELVRLGKTTPADDPGKVAYREQFERDDDESLVREVIYCTHAMLGVDLVKRLRTARSMDGEREDRMRSISALSAKRAQASAEGRKTDIGKEIGSVIADDQRAAMELDAEYDLGYLPPWQYLLVDEAHLLESNLAAAMSSTLSVMSYVRLLKSLNEKGLVSEAAASRARKAANALHACAPDSGDDLDLNNRGDANSAQARSALAELADAFTAAKIKKTDRADPLVALAARQAQEINLGISGNAGAGWNRLLQFSPIRVYPQLFVGRQNIGGELAFLWGRTTGAACVSASLYLRRLDADSAGYYREILSIPVDRALEFPPIRPAWTLKPVVGLWTPEARRTGARFWLQPPSRADKLSPDAQSIQEELWLDEVEQALRSILHAAAGGTLVLMTSYLSVKKMADRLGDVVHKVVANPNHALAQQRKQFVDCALKGYKPVWLALGGAWTGLDINGENHGIKQPGEDQLLTDLVIPRIPFSLNRTMTHHFRSTKRSDIPWELLDTAMRLKQGLGRLIRREGLHQNRRIFVLDGRLNDPRFDGYSSLLKRIMNIYPQKTLKHPVLP